MLMVMEKCLSAALVVGIELTEPPCPLSPRPSASPLLAGISFAQGPQILVSQRPCYIYLKTSRSDLCFVTKKFSGSYRVEKPMVDPRRHLDIWLLVPFLLLVASFFLEVSHFMCIQIIAG